MIIDEVPGEVAAMDERTRAQIAAPKAHRFNLAAA
jgi:hypothetical protein